MINVYRDLAIKAVTAFDVITAMMQKDNQKEICDFSEALKDELDLADIYSGELPDFPESDAGEERRADASEDDDHEIRIQDEEFENDIQDEDPIETYPMPAPVFKRAEAKTDEKPEEKQSVDDAILDSVDEGKVVRIPGVKAAPLPNDHPVDLKGSGRSGIPPVIFRMREVGKEGWKEGTASELAKTFNVTPSQIYKWGNGKTESRYFDVEKVR